MTFRSVSILGLARSGRAAAELALANGIKVYARDAAGNETLRETARHLAGRGADVELGRADVDKIIATDAIIVSPGIPPHAPPFNDAHVARKKRISELEFASRFLK